MSKERKQEEEYMKFIQENYKYIHPELLEIENWKINSKLELKEEIPGIYTFDLLSEETCRDLLEETENFQNWINSKDIECKRIRSVPQHGVLLTDLGYDNVLKSLIHNYFKEIIKEKYKFVDEIVDHHAFTIEYEIGKDIKLDFHVDDSEVSFNICLGKEFEGGEVQFLGCRCYNHLEDKPSKEEYFLIKHKIGRAVCHIGQQRHLVKNLTKGFRSNMIIWCKSQTRTQSFCKKHLCVCSREEKGML